ncbi:hypothetical protein GW17_00041060 [Ensete ventricosum]|nr:hypothetical protein GW17_00041060 [Ensete ventricosum]
MRRSLPAPDNPSDVAPPPNAPLPLGPQFWRPSAPQSPFADDYLRSLGLNYYGAPLQLRQPRRETCKFSLLSHWWKMEAEKGKPEIVWKAEKLVAATMGGRDASHDAAHAFRVRGLALSLAKEEALSGPSLEIVRIYPPILFSYFFVLQQFHPVRKRYDDGALST